MISGVCTEKFGDLLGSDQEVLLPGHRRHRTLLLNLLNRPTSPERCDSYTLLQKTNFQVILVSFL